MIHICKSCIHNEGMLTPFGTMLVAAYSALGMSQRDFSEAVGMSQPNISKMTRGDPRVKGPPLDALDSWMDVLRISGVERDRFRQMAHLAHATDEVQKLVESQRLELSGLRQKFIDLQAELDRIRKKNSKVVRDA